jgi:hypothetical protein
VEEEVEIKDTVNPVGEVIKDDAIEVFVEAMQKQWDETKPSVPWWKFWKRISFTPVTNYLIQILDDLVAYLIEHNIPGEDKKATVLDAIGKVYDYIVAAAMPFWLKPFSGMIRRFILETVLSASIDWIVEKYKNGDWRPKPANEVVAQWHQLHAQLFGVPDGHRPK